MASVLLDTNALVWLALGVRMGTESKNIISKSDTVYVSALSILELRIKQSYGKLLAAEKVIASLDAMQVSVLPLSRENLDDYRIYHAKNRDPFDSALISVAIGERLPLITADRDILSLNQPKLKCIDASK